LFESYFHGKRFKFHVYTHLRAPGDLKFRQLTKDLIAYEKGELRIKGLPYEEEDAQPIL
jgi:hypothetical protein